jgi:uncharacterized protein (TIGR02246 family)
MMRRTLLSALGLLLFAVPAPAQPAKNPELQKVADAFVAAWNKADAKALAALHTENAITAGTEGQITVGRAAIEQGFAKAFAAELKGTKLAVTPGDERAVNADLAITSGTWVLSGDTPPPPGAATKGTYLNTLVKQGGKWLIAGSAPIPAPAKP